MKKIMILIFVAVSYITEAQQWQQSSFYMFNTMYYNPAYAGTRNTLNVAVIGRKQYVGFDGSPSSEFVSVNSPIANRRMGIGLHINNDFIGSRKKFSVYGNVAGSIKLNDKGSRLSVGISAGIDNYSFGFASLYAIDQNDPIATSSMNLLKANVGAGLYYFGKKHYLGFSVPMIIKSNAEFNSIKSNISDRHFILTGGYVFHLNSTLDFKPSTIIKYVPGAPVSFDVNASFLAYKKIWLGGMYRYDEGVGLNFSIVLNKNITVGYAFDYPINELRTNQWGSHEVMLQFDFSKYKGQGNIYSPRYF